jgi:nicotinate phosphoribosyltransferase
LFDEPFLKYLEGFAFTGTVRAISEGEVVFPPEALLEVTAPRIEAQIVETFLLNQMSFQTMVASKASRVVLAARGRPVVDFSPRRDHGVDAAIKVARCAYLAGCAGTSNTLAGKMYGLPVYGTMAHSYVMSYDDELASFRAYAWSFPDACLSSSTRTIRCRAHTTPQSWRRSYEPEGTGCWGYDSTVETCSTSAAGCDACSTTRASPTLRFWRPVI